MHPSDEDKTEQPVRSSHPLMMLYNFIRHLGRQALALIGLFLVIIAVPIAFATPIIPVGLPIGLVGVALLGRNSVWGQNLLNYGLSKKPDLERLIPDTLMKLVFGRPKLEKYRKTKPKAGDKV